MPLTGFWALTPALTGIIIRLTGIRYREVLRMQEQQSKEQPKGQEINYTELLEKEYSKFKVARAVIQDCREDGISDKEIYETLESFY